MFGGMSFSSRALASVLTGLLWFLVVLAAFLPAGASGQLAPGAAAPELIAEGWLNVAPTNRLTLASRLGKVTVVHFWTYGCINCRHNLPIYDAWQKRFAPKDVLIIGIHAPETAAEAKPDNVARKVKELGISYPVLLDSKRYNWNRWRQRAWPTVYLVDKQGRARYSAIGELKYKGGDGDAKMSALIESLIKE